VFTDKYLEGIIQLSHHTSVSNTGKKRAMKKTSCGVTAERTNRNKSFRVEQNDLQL